MPIGSRVRDTLAQTGTIIKDHGGGIVSVLWDALYHKEEVTSIHKLALLA